MAKKYPVNVSDVMEEFDEYTSEKKKPEPLKPAMKNKTVEIDLTPEKIQEAKKAILQFGDGKVGRDILHMLASRYKVLYIQSHEEDRVINCFRQISFVKGYELIRWDASRGLCAVFTGQKVSDKNTEIHEDPSAVLSYIIDRAKVDNEKMSKKEPMANGGTIFFLLDFHPYLENVPLIERKIKEFSKIHSYCCIVVISPVFKCPPTLEKVMTVIDFPYPSVEEIGNKLQETVNDTSEKHPFVKDEVKGKEEEIIKAAKGLTIDEVGNAYARSLVKKKTFDIPTILDEKKQIIRKSGILEYLEPRFTFDNVGGLDDLKEWLLTRRLAFKEDARKFGLDMPKGVLFISPPGTGKSMVCEALASAYEMPLLRLDMGAVFGSLVGESELRIRQVIKVAESVSPCILFGDEIEKGLGGVASSNQTDGGTTNRVFGTMLTWLSEKSCAVFFVATANNVLSIPPEFMRAGRFDEIFFLDLPDEDQRCDVIDKLLIRKKRNPDNFDIFSIAKNSEHYSPAEIEKGINNALFVAYANNRCEVLTEDIVSELGKFQPLYNTRREEIEATREWALGSDGKGGRARLANSTKVKKHVPVMEKPESRRIDLSADDL